MRMLLISTSEMPTQSSRLISTTHSNHLVLQEKRWELVFFLETFSGGALGGQIENMQTPTSWVKNILAQELRKPSDPNAEAPRPQPGKIPGRGAFLLPPAWVGEAPVISLSDRLEGIRVGQREHRNVVLRTTYKNFPLVVTQSGCFAIGVEDPVLASSHLNEVFAMLLFAGQSAFAITPTDLLRIYDMAAPFDSFGWDDNLHPEHEKRLQGEIAWRAIYERIATIATTSLNAIISQAEHLTRNGQRGLVMKLCLDSWTGLIRRDHRNAFLTAWTAIELGCSKLLENYLAAQETRTQLIKEAERWDISWTLDVLEISKHIPADKASAINGLRQTRNRALHSGEALTVTQAEQAVEAAINFTTTTWEIPFEPLLLNNLPSKTRTNSQ
jgi:hypothetical protein